MAKHINKIISDFNEDIITLKDDFNSRALDLNHLYERMGLDFKHRVSLVFWNSNDRYLVVKTNDLDKIINHGMDTDVITSFSEEDAPNCFCKGDVYTVIQEASYCDDYVSMFFDNLEEAFDEYILNPQLDVQSNIKTLVAENYDQVYGN